MKYKGILKGPRWAGVLSAIKEAAFILDLMLIKATEEKSLLRTTVMFEVQGSEENIQKFIDVLDKSVDEYNS